MPHLPSVRLSLLHVTCRMDELDRQIKELEEGVRYKLQANDLESEIKRQRLYATMAEYSLG